MQRGAPPSSGSASRYVYPFRTHRGG